MRFEPTPVRWFKFAGRTPGKKIKTRMFLRDVPMPVYDPKEQRMLMAAPYMIEVPAPDMSAPPAPSPPPPPSVDDVLDRRIALRAQLDELNIGYDKRWGVERLEEQLALAMNPAAPAPEPVDG